MDQGFDLGFELMLVNTIFLANLLFDTILSLALLQDVRC